MALYTRKEICEMCGVAQAAISTNITRGNIIMRGEFVDDAIPENRKIIDRWIKNKEKKQRGTKRKNDRAEMPVPAEVKPKIKNLKPPDVPAPEKISDKSKGEDEDYWSVETKKTTIAYKEAQIRILAIKEANLRGENIPTNLVMAVISLLGQSFQTSYKNGAHMLLMEISHKLKMSPEIEAEFNGKLIESINDSHKNSIKIAKNSIKSILSEVSNPARTEKQ